MWVRCFEEPDLSSVLPSSNLGVLSDTKTKSVPLLGMWILLEPTVNNAFDSITTTMTCALPV